MKLEVSRFYKSFLDWLWDFLQLLKPRYQLHVIKEHLLTLTEISFLRKSMYSNPNWAEHDFYSDSRQINSFYSVAAFSMCWVFSIPLSIHSQFVCTAVQYYDYFTTLSDEVNLFWLPPATFGTRLFLFIRYLSILGHIPVILQNRPFHSNLVGLSQLSHLFSPNWPVADVRMFDNYSTTSTNVTLG